MRCVNRFTCLLQGARYEHRCNAQGDTDVRTCRPVYLFTPAVELLQDRLPVLLVRPAARGSGHADGRPRRADLGAVAHRMTLPKDVSSPPSSFERLALNWPCELAVKPWRVAASAATREAP